MKRKSYLPMTKRWQVVLASELLFRTVNPANQLSIYGALKDWCDALAQQILDQSFSSIVKSIAKVNEQLNRKLAPEEVNTLTKASETDVQRDKSDSNLRNSSIHEESFFSDSASHENAETVGRTRGFEDRTSHPGQSHVLS